MNKYLIVVVVSVLALTGCDSEEKLLLGCYTDSETQVKFREDNDITVFTMRQYRQKYGVDSEGYITQWGRDRCQRMIERGEFTKSCMAKSPSDCQ